MVPFKCGFLQWERFRIPRSPTGGLPCLLSIVIHYPKTRHLEDSMAVSQNAKVGLFVSFLFALLGLYLW